MQSRGEQGLTLVEVLVVLAIIGVMSGIAVLGLGGTSRGAGTQTEAHRLAESIQLAADEAMVTERTVALDWDVEGYSIVEWSAADGGWRPMEAGGFGGRHQLPPDISLEGMSEAPVPIGENRTLEFTVSGDPTSWNVRFDGLNTEAAPANSG